MVNMLDEISEAYDRLLKTYSPKFQPIAANRNWHLQLTWIPDGKPEVIYSLDYRKGKLKIVIVRFLESAWRKFWNACNHRYNKVSVEFERGEMELPSDHSIVSHVSEGLPRLCVNDAQAVLDGEQFKLSFCDNSGTFESQAWKPYQRHVVTWIKLIDSVRGAGALVPRRFVSDD